MKKIQIIIIIFICILFYCSLAQIINNIETIYDISTNTTLIAWEEDSNYNSNNKNGNIWTTFIHNTNKITIKTSLIGFNPSLVYSSITKTGNTNIVYLIYLFENNGNISLMLSTSNDFGYTWNTKILDTYSNVVNNINLYTSIDKIKLNANRDNNLMICSDNNLQIKCYASLDNGNTFINTNLVNVGGNYCKYPKLISTGISEWIISAFCSDDGILYLPKYLRLSLGKLNLVDVISYGSVVIAPDLIIPDFKNNNLYTDNSNIEHIILKNDGIYRSSFITNLFTLRNYTMYKVLDNNNDISNIIDFLDNERWVYASYLNNLINIYQSFDNGLSFNLVNSYNSINITYISLFTNYINTITIITSDLNNNILINYINLNNITVNNTLFDTNSVVLPGIVINPNSITNVNIETILYGDIIIENNLDIINATLNVNGDLNLSSGKKLTIKNSNIDITNTVVLSGELILNNTNNDKKIIIMSYNGSIGKFDNVTFNGINIEDDDCINLEYTQSRLELITDGCKKTEEINIIMIIIIVSIITVILIAVVIIMVKFKNKIFIYRKRIHYKVELESDTKITPN